MKFRIRIMWKRGKDQHRLMHKLRARTELRMIISPLNNKSINQVSRDRISKTSKTIVLKDYKIMCIEIETLKHNLT